MPDLPILGQSGGPNGGAGLAAIDKKYAVELITADGAKHVLTLHFERPKSLDGTVDLGALRGFDPKRQALAGVTEKIARAWYAPMQEAAIVDGTEGGAIIVWRQVTSFRFLGEWSADLSAVMTGSEVIHYPLMKKNTA